MAGKYWTLFILVLAFRLPSSTTAPVEPQPNFYERILLQCPALKNDTKFAQQKVLKACSDVGPIEKIEIAPELSKDNQRDIWCSIYYDAFTSYCTTASPVNATLPGDVSTKYTVSQICENATIAPKSNKKLYEYLKTPENCKAICEDLAGYPEHLCSLSYYFRTMIHPKAADPVEIKKQAQKTTEKPAVEGEPDGQKPLIEPEKKSAINPAPNSEPGAGAQNGGPPAESAADKIDTGSNKDPLPPPLNPSNNQNAVQDHDVPSKVPVPVKIEKSDASLSKPEVNPQASAQDVQKTQEEPKKTETEPEPDPSNVEHPPAAEPPNTVENKQQETKGEEKDPDRSFDEGNADISNPNLPADQEEQFLEEADNDDTKPDFQIIAKPNKIDESVTSDTEMDGDSYFFSYFMVLCVLFVMGYVGYHNKQKILALILEGRRGRRQHRGRRPNSANYHKLDSNLEEAISSSCSKNTTNVIY